MKTIKLIDHESRHDRFEIEADRTYVLSTIGQVCRRVRLLCPDLPKRDAIKIPIPDDVVADIKQDAENSPAMRASRERMKELAAKRHGEAIADRMLQEHGIQIDEDSKISLGLEDRCQPSATGR